MLVKHNKRHTWYGEEITREKYDEILSVLHNIPQAPKGFAYRLTESLEWELYKLPEPELEEIEATEADYQAALAEMGVQV